MSTQISNVLKADIAELVRVQKLRRWVLSIYESIKDFPEITKSAINSLESRLVDQKNLQWNSPQKLTKASDGEL